MGDRWPSADTFLFHECQSKRAGDGQSQMHAAQTILRFVSLLCFDLALLGSQPMTVSAVGPQMFDTVTYNDNVFAATMLSVGAIPGLSLNLDPQTVHL